MTEEQAHLVLKIVAGLEEGALTGAWPQQTCQFCSGESDGYDDYQYFNHRADCIVRLMRQLRHTLVVDD